MTIGNFISNALGRLSYSFGGGTNPDDTRWLMGQQSQLWRDDTQWLNENGWKQLRKGLIDADYNPLLAMGTSPSSAPMTSANATDGMRSLDVDSASAITANTAKEMSKSQISVNNATARKTNQEALTQQNIRSNLNADTALKLAQKIWGDTKLPYETKLMYTQQLMNVATANLNQTTASWLPFNSTTGRISANAARNDSVTNRYRQRADAARRSAEVRMPLGFGVSASGVYGKY